MPRSRGGQALEGALPGDLDARSSEEPTATGGLSAPDAAGAPRGAERKVPFTNLTKVFWPDEGYTKGDLIEYYRTIAPFLLPYFKDRPLVLTRYQRADGLTIRVYRVVPPLCRATIDVEAIYGWFDRRPYADVEDMIFVTRRR